MGFRYEVKVGGRFYDNAVIFATHAEAQRAADNKLWSWTQAEEVRVVEDEREANYRQDADTGAIVHIATEGATSAG